MKSVNAGNDIALFERNFSRVGVIDSVIFVSKAGKGEQGVFFTESILDRSVIDLRDNPV